MLQTSITGTYNITAYIGIMTEYINCSICHMKCINDDEHIKTEFGYTRLNIRYTHCVKCRSKQSEHRYTHRDEWREPTKGLL